MTARCKRIQTGARVRLTKTAAKLYGLRGRRKTGTVQVCLEDIPGGVKLDTALDRVFRYWNTADLEVIKV